ncbi:MAG: tRNA (adenosine(37)-N6)-threonylcarbamoyltransferase complex dimerization subunit type 1 TsaB [Saprospiraceae bacterium]|jgi:tRNA threonylcarbamoyladenosine biosynthesis protein TsaB
MTSRILCLETATEVCSVAVAIDGRVVGHREAAHPWDHASRVTVLIGECLKEAGMDIGELSAVAVSVGPGSYTGLRVGFACAKGICSGLGIPLIGVDTLHSLALAAASDGDDAESYIIPMIDARRLEVYASVYAPDGQMVQPPSALILEPESFHDYFLRGPVVFVGNGADKWRTLTANSDKSLFPNIRCSALHLINPAREAWRAEAFQNLAYFSPYYLKPPNITQPKKKS